MSKKSRKWIKNVDICTNMFKKMVKNHRKFIKNYKNMLKNTVKTWLMCEKVVDKYQKFD